MRWPWHWFSPLTPAPTVPAEILAIPGQPFTVPPGRRLRATTDGLVVALPITVFGDGPLGDTFSMDAEAEISIPDRGDVFYVRLRAGMTFAVNEACDGVVIASDQEPRRLVVMPGTR
jgi:hypothetical protein